MPCLHLGLLSPALGSCEHDRALGEVGLLSPLSIPGEPRWRLYCMCVDRGSPACCACLWHLQFLILFRLGSRLVLFEEGSLFLLLFLRTKSASFFSKAIVIYLSHLQFKNVK